MIPAQHRPILLLFLVAVLVNAPVACGEESLREFAEGLQGRYAYGAYLANKKMGWAVVDARLGEHHGDEALVVESELKLSIMLSGARHSVALQNKSIYDLDGDGLLVYCEEREQGDDGHLALATGCDRA